MTINDILTNAIEANQEELRLYGCCQAAQASAALTWDRLTDATPAAFIRKVDPDEIFSGSLDLDQELDDLAQARGIQPNLQARWKKQTAVVLRADLQEGEPQFSLYRLAKTRNNELTIHIYRELTAGVLEMINHYVPAMLDAEKKRKEALDEFFYACYVNKDPDLIERHWWCIPNLLGVDDEECNGTVGKRLKWCALDKALCHDFKGQKVVDADQLQEVLAKSYKKPISDEKLKDCMKAMLWQYNQADNTFTKPTISEL